MLDLDAGLMPWFRDKVNGLIIRMEEDGQRVGVHSGLRTVEEQDRLYALGRTAANPDGKSDKKPLGDIVTRAKGGQSWHNWGLAADVVFQTLAYKNEEARWNWSWSENLPWGILGLHAGHLGLEWGGAWKFKDLPHVQLTAGLTLAEAQRIGKVEDVWKEVMRRLADQTDAD